MEAYTHMSELLAVVLWSLVTIDADSNRWASCDVMRDATAGDRYCMHGPPGQVN